MQFRNQVVIVNVGILAGVAFEYYQGAPMLAIAIAGVILLILGNAIFYLRGKKRKRDKSLAA